MIMIRASKLSILPAMCLAVALLGSGTMTQAVGATAPAAQAKPAEVVAREFYTWYVGLMPHDKEPTDEPATYVRYVSKPLRAAIARQAAAPEVPDEDYFLKAQDYLDGWVGHVAATPAKVQGNTAQTVVTLGGAKPWRLAVKLVREDGAWKIAGVGHR